jgi:hypothetical protein
MLGKHNHGGAFAALVGAFRVDYLEQLLGDEDNILDLSDG